MLLTLSPCASPDKETFSDMVFQLSNDGLKRKDEFVILRKNADKELPSLVLYKFWVLTMRASYVAHAPAFYHFKDKTLEQANYELRRHGLSRKRFYHKLKMAEWLYKQYLSNEIAYLPRVRYEKPVRVNDYGMVLLGTFKSDSL